MKEENKENDFIWNKENDFFSKLKMIVNLFCYKIKVTDFCIKILIQLSYVRKITSFLIPIFCSPVPLLFLFHFRDSRCLILLNGV